MSTIYNLHFKWTVSRGRDTYGYNICTLYVNGEKAGKCMGGGYDMQGTSFAQWIERNFEMQLNGLFMEEIIAFKNIPFTELGHKNAITLRDKDGNKFYGTSLFEKKGGKIALHLDGSCGFSSMERIAKAIGIQLQWNKESDRYKNHTFYTAIIN